MTITATEALIGLLPPEKIRGFQKGTVVADFEPTTDLRVTMDGDTDPSHVMSNVGELQAGQKVMVVFTEPHGAYVAWLLHPPAWRLLPHHAGWVNVGVVAGVTYGPIMIRRVGDQVQCRGMTKRTSGTDASIADIPVGFRIPNSLPFPGESAGAFCSLYAIAADGGAGADTIFYNGGGTPASAVGIASITYSVTP